MQDGIGGLRDGYEYARGGNPTRTALETQLAALEGGMRGLSFASGLAAEDALLRAVLAPGDHVLLGNDVYGGTYRLIRKVLGAWGVRHTTVDTSDLDAVRAAIEPGSTKVVWVETPSNPLMKITDIAALAELGHEAGALVVVDNTFASPALQQPLALGADVVVHSTTKYLGGHSDVVGGGLVFAADRRSSPRRSSFLQFAVGAVSGPFDAWLTSRGIKTLGIRMQRHSENALAIARRLEGHAGHRARLLPRARVAPRPRARRRARCRASAAWSRSSLAGGAEAARRFAESTRCSSSPSRSAASSRS